MVAPLSLSLLHQAMAMVVLTIATLHAASVAEPAPRVLVSPGKADDAVICDAAGVAH
jgi:heme A synthase